MLDLTESNSFKINHALVKSLHPCEDRYKNFVQQYPDFNGSITDFLKLELISYYDKLWVWRHIALKNDSVLFAIKCANSVLVNYESEYPEDKAPRKAIRAAVTYLISPTAENMHEARSAADSAALSAYSAADSAARSAVYSAYAAARSAYAAARSAYSAALSAYSAADSAYSAADSAALSAYSAADSAYSADSARLSQQALHIQFLLEIYEGR